MDGSRRRVLYISYTGLLEPLGQSQVYRYLRKLSDGHDITLITFERPADVADRERFESLREDLAAYGIRWRPLRYHRRPSLPATLWDLARGFARCIWAIRRYDVEIVHARSYVPSVLGLLCTLTFGTAFVFDMRGFWADERVDADFWDEGGWLYRVVKWLEARFLTRADVVVSLTEAGVEAIRNFDHVDTDGVRFEVIPTCVDLDLFSPEPARDGDEFVLGYVGSVGTWYRFDDVLDCFEILRELRPDSRLSILNHGDHEYIRGRLAAFDVDDNSVSLRSVEHEEVPEEMNRMDAGVLFYTPTFSKRGTSPTKMGEFLACGVPCLSNSSVGDVDAILEENDVGVTIDAFDVPEKRRAVESLLELASDPTTAKRCRAVAESYYSLDAGVEKYDEIYRSVVGPSE